MFKWINKQGVESDEGFVIQSVDRFTIEYIEGSKKVSVNVSRGSSSPGRYCVDIAANAFSRWDGDSMVIPTEKQHQMLQNFKAAMSFQGLDVFVNNEIDQNATSDFDFANPVVVPAYRRKADGSWEKLV